MHHISRIDSKSTHGWYVRTYSEGSCISRLFSDGKSRLKGRGGKGRAKLRAILYRDIAQSLSPTDKKSKLILAMAFKQAMKKD